MNSNYSFIGTLVVLVIFALIYVPPLIKILHKAGYSGWWILVSFIPLVNIVMIWVFAFANWPSLARLQTPTV